MKKLTKGNVSTRFRKASFLFILSAILSGAVVTPVAAHAAPNSYGAKTFLNGYIYDYWGQNLLIRMAASGNASTQTAVFKTSEKFPSMWVAVQLKIYSTQNGGFLDRVSGWYFNPESTKYFSRDTTQIGVYGPRYAQGEVRTWNGNGYDHWWPGATGIINY